MTKTVYLGLGSNLGDRTANLATALHHLEKHGVQILRRSSIYESEPQEVRDQPWFLNLVVEVETRLFPKQLLARILQIETTMGRKRIIPKGPRIIDIDILFYGRSVVNTESLVIPHPGIPNRRFVLEPLAELAPDFRHPLTHESVTDLLSRVRSQPTHRASSI